MLLSGSMPSYDDLMTSSFLARTFLSCSAATISASVPFPTVSLDLTQTSNPLQLRGSSQFRYLSSNPLQLRGSGQFPVLHHQGASPATLADTVTALTAEPNFLTALAATISFVFGGAQPNNGRSTNNGNVATKNVNNME
ncbi:hypothetical protein L2E82_17258 [Cichorium intybus]|uniref:Uncharacterized protein n=1 Tax=Cichorium intybus TaxID=13427 RepID=A0ACB9F902_CICIN|nr:hypothetical protein L2E82_17258 [Cichorium intybus]